jgi:hypothetical protein
MDTLFKLSLLVLFVASCCHGHLMQTLKNLNVMSNDAGSLRGLIHDQHSIKGYLQVSYFSDAATCQTLNSIYYYQLDTCHHSGDPNAVAEFVKITMILKEKLYHMQWTYYKDSQCTSIVGYPNGGSVNKQVCYNGASIEVIGKIPQTPPSPQLLHNSLLLLLFPRADTCNTRSPMYASQALFTSTNKCLYNYYHDLMYNSCNAVNFSGQIFGSKDGSCSHGSTSFTHNQKDPCQSDDINLDATYAGYYHFICFN